MTKEIMDRRASDNEYLHRDFHGALSCGIDYLEEHYGADAVRDYLREFTLTYYAPLRRALRERGLTALREYFENLYRTEGGDVDIEMTDKRLAVRVAACPAVTHMRKQGYPVARLFHETTRTVNETLCEGSPFTAELAEYDPETGRSVQLFRKKES